MATNTDREMMRAYRERWKVVAARELEELRAATIEQRWHQLNAVIGLAIGLGLRRQEDPDVYLVRRRWTQLKVAGHPEAIEQLADVDSTDPQWLTKDGSIMTESREIAHLRSSLVAVQRLLAGFNDRGIVIGGVAASLLGKPRLTRDVDVTVLLSIEDVPELIRAAADEGLVPRIADAENFARQSRVVLLLHQESNINVDVSLGILPFEVEAVERSSIHQIGSLSIRLPTPEDLIIFKAVAHRPRDLQDIQDLIQTNPNLDRERIRSWVGEFAQLLEQPELWDDIAGWL